MDENVRAFLKAAEADPELRERMTRMDAGQLAATAREMGFELTDADFQPPAGELGENDLGNVAGGGFCICPALGGGGGTDDTNGETYGCGCVVYGQGGDGRITDVNCCCLIAGAGTDWDEIP